MDPCQAAVLRIISDPSAGEGGVHVNDVSAGGGGQALLPPVLACAGTCCACGPASPRPPAAAASCCCRMPDRVAPPPGARSAAAGLLPPRLPGLRAVARRGRAVRAAERRARLHHLRRRALEGHRVTRGGGGASAVTVQLCFRAWLVGSAAEGSATQRTPAAAQLVPSVMCRPQDARITVPMCPGALDGVRSLSQGRHFPPARER